MAWWGWGVWHHYGHMTRSDVMHLSLSFDIQPKNLSAQLLYPSISTNFIVFIPYTSLAIYTEILMRSIQIYMLFLVKMLTIHCTCHLGHGCIRPWWSEPDIKHNNNFTVTAYLCHYTDLLEFDYRWQDLLVDDSWTRDQKLVIFFI